MSDFIKRPKHDQFPFAPDPHDLYGWTLARRKKLVDSLETVLHEGMQAVKHARITHQGEVTEEYEDVDYMARLRSAELVSRVTGLRASNKEAQRVAQNTIKPPAWACLGTGGRVIAGDKPREPKTETLPGDGKPQPD